MPEQLKFLLANMPWQRGQLSGVRAGSRWPHLKHGQERDYLPFPFFLAYATSLLQKNGKKAILIDAIAEGLTGQGFLDKVSNMDINYLVTETSVPSFSYDLDLLRQVSERGVSIVLCGPNTQMYQPQFLKDTPFIDFVLCGEYEATLLELADHLESGGELSGVRGLMFRKDGRIIKNADRELLDVNSLPWPHRETLPMERYLDAPGAMPTPSAQMVASRGCPFGCGFCLWPQVMYGGRHYRPRAVKDVIDEMEYLVKEKGFRSIYFDDDTFNIGKSRMLEFCDEIIKRRLEKTPWAIMARPDLMDEDILSAFKKAGLWAIKYGVESGVQELVNNIGKDMDLKKSSEMIRLTQKLGIRTHLTFTFGLPGETRDTIERTIRFARSLSPFSVQFSITTPFPGTSYYSALEKEGRIISKDLSDYDGHGKSVMRLASLAPGELEKAKRRAYDSWAWHLRLKKMLSYINRFIGLPGKDDILLIQCPPWDIAMPPLGIAYLATYLKKHGLHPKTYDLNISLYHSVPEELKYFWEPQNFNWWVDNKLFSEMMDKLEKAAYEHLLKALSRTDVGIIGLSASTTSIRFSCELIKRIKELRPNAKIVVGGWGCITEHMRRMFPSELVDVFVMGEGEQTLKEVLEALRSGHANRRIPGAIFKEDGLSVFKPRHPIPDINTIPWPTFSEFDLKQYKFPSLPIMSSRGCISHCNFCNDWQLTRPYRYYKAENIFAQIKYYVDTYQYRVFSFKDLLCNGNVSELNRFSDMVIGSGLRISWDSQAIAHNGMTPALLKKLQKTGCVALIYGIESFSDNVLKKMGKLFDSQTAERILRDTYDAGIQAMINIIVGFPGETEEDFCRTVDAIKRNRKYIHQIGAVSVCNVNNDSDMEFNPDKYGIVLSEDASIRAKKWASSDGLNTYELRKDRAQKVMRLLSELGLSACMYTV